MVLSKAKYLLIGMGTLLLAFCLLLGPTFAFATPAEEKQAEADAALEELTEKQEYLDEMSNAYTDAVMKQQEAEAAVEAAQATIDADNARIAELQKRLSSRARTMYREGGFSLIDILLDSTSFMELLSNWEFLDIMNESDANLIQETKTLREEVEQQKLILVEQEKIAEQKAAEAKKVMEEAQVVVDEMQEIYDNLSEEAAELLAAERAAAYANASANVGSSSSRTGGNYNNGYAGVADAGSVVGRAQSYVGNGEYVFGACEPGAFDCSGFVSYCLTGSYSRLGNTYTFLGWTEVSDPQPGDVCVNEGHCGIYLGGGMMAHAASPEEGIIISGVQSGMIFVRY